MNRNPPDYTAWQRPKAWPYDAPGYVYMMRAAEQIGSTLSADWKGIGNNAARLAVLEAIREHCAYGRLTAAAMVYDGTFKKVPAHKWNTSDCWKWFPTCTTTNFDVCGAGVHPLAGVTHFPLYVTEASLRQLLNPGENIAVPAAPDTAREPLPKKRKSDETEDERRDRLAGAVAYLETRSKQQLDPRWDYDTWILHLREKRGLAKSDAEFVWRAANLTDWIRGAPGPGRK